MLQSMITKKAIEGIKGIIAIASNMKVVAYDYNWLKDHSDVAIVVGYFDLSNTN